MTLISWHEKKPLELQTDKPVCARNQGKIDENVYGIVSALHGVPAPDNRVHYLLIKIPRSHCLPL